MGKVILCTGKRAKKPYIFNSTGTAVYTTEEMCYYIARNVETAGEDLLACPAADFFLNELDLPERAEKLAALYEKSPSVREVTVVVLCSSDYFGESEIKKILSELRKLEDMTDCERRKVFADRAVRDGRLRDAFADYTEIIACGDKTGLSDSDLSAVLHNTGVIYARNDSYTEAAECFAKAYELTGNTESRRQFLFALKLAGITPDYLSVTKSDETEEEVREEIENELGRLRAGEETNINFAQLNRMKRLLYEGKVTEYDKLANEMISRLKSIYRHKE